VPLKAAGDFSPLTFAIPYYSPFPNYYQLKEGNQS
jgi:hypothetical protein